MIESPDYPHIVMAFTYGDFKVEIDQSEDHGQVVYAAWVSYEQGCAVAVPCVYSRNEAVWKAKQWCDKRTQEGRG
ncbi:MAG: hypothetical protein ICV77_03545 [Cyanobacteria bacterium Co-bin8]|nr:hypothetical protein [Cyanobacteria bacterium Co-bin8]